MAEYYMTSGLWKTKVMEFDNDVEAWNTLRLALPNKFVILKKCVEFPCKLVNPQHYITRFNSAYAKAPYGHGSSEPIDTEATELPSEEYIPIMKGLADDEYVV